jgi:hypothetical protein
VNYFTINAHGLLSTSQILQRTLPAKISIRSMKSGRDGPSVEGQYFKRRFRTQMKRRLCKMTISPALCRENGEERSASSARFGIGT